MACLGFEPVTDEWQAIELWQTPIHCYWLCQNCAFTKFQLIFFLTQFSVLKSHSITQSEVEIGSENEPCDLFILPPHILKREILQTFCARHCVKVFLCGKDFLLNWTPWTPKTKFRLKDDFIRRTTISLVNNVYPWAGALVLCLWVTTHLRKVGAVCWMDIILHSFVVKHVCLFEKTKRGRGWPIFLKKNNV